VLPTAKVLLSVFGVAWSASQRKLGVRTEVGRTIAFPRMPRVAELPVDWQHFSQKARQTVDAGHN
jgi:hypothetical protein